MRRIKRYDCFYRCGQLASANYGDGKSEDFLWDGLALVKRGDERFINEPHVGNAPQKLCFGGKPRAKRSARRARNGPRGNPVVSSKGTSYFNDMLGTTVGAKAKGKYSAAALTAFGENHLTTQPPNHQTFFTGKPYIEGLGHAFLFRNYRAGLGKWLTADPLGYPDGWNQLGYLGNSANFVVDLYGACRIPRQGYEEDWVNFDGYRFGLKAYWTCNHNFDAPNIVGHWSENIEDGSQNVIDDYSYRGYHAVLVFFTNEITNTFTLASHNDFLNHVYNLLIEVEVYAYVYYVDENGIEHSESMWDRPVILELTNHHTITRYQE